MYADEKLKEFVVDCAENDDLKAELMNDPRGTLLKNGIEVVDGMEVEVVQNSLNKIYLVLPASVDDDVVGQSTRSTSNTCAGGLTGTSCW